MTNYFPINFILLAISACFLPAGVNAQPAFLLNDAVLPYQAAAPKCFDLQHTKLDLRFDFKKKQLWGKAWITAKPHAYHIDSFPLDALGMTIHEVALIEKTKRIKPLFSYDGRKLVIKLNKTYQPGQSFTVYIDYTASPENLKGRRKNQKGLYFINTDEADKTKPVQIWTEGETENSSIWFPTIDKPQQKTTAEIRLTVPARFVTLSSGRLTSQVKNADGTRRDTWIMDRPNAPYLYMLAVGDFKIYKDTWKGKQVSYYLEPAYARNAKKIFGQTPEMIDFFSKTLGVDFPWSKYAQIVVRDYISGAMENTTATVFGEDMQGTSKELNDRYYHTGIAHELFHQWFGDYVTAESWGNLALNESLAVLGEFIWLEYKYGKDVADAHFAESMKGYFNDTGNYARPLARFSYKDASEVFDGVTYQKGGCILYLLRSYLGTAVFNKGLQLYLQQNAFKNAEIHQLRLAFEEASGMDLNWFFEQWFFGAGHPIIKTSYQWNEMEKTETIYVQQLQGGHQFIIPLAVDLYTAQGTLRKQAIIRNRLDTITIPLNDQPYLVNTDADKTLIAEKVEIKSTREYAYQFFHAPLYLDRLEALDAATKYPAEVESGKILTGALVDPSAAIRIKALHVWETLPGTRIEPVLPLLINIADHDDNNMARAAAIVVLGKLKSEKNIDRFKKYLSADSYAIQAAALNALSEVDPTTALTEAKKLESDAKAAVYDALLKLYTHFGGEEQWSYVYPLFTRLAPPKRYNIIRQFADLVGRVNNDSLAREGITEIKELGLLGKQYGIIPEVIEILTEVKIKRLQLNDQLSAGAIDRAINDLNL